MHHLSPYNHPTLGQSFLCGAAEQQETLFSVYEGFRDSWKCCLHPYCRVASIGKGLYVSLLSRRTCPFTSTTACGPGNHVSNARSRCRTLHAEARRSWFRGGGIQEAPKRVHSRERRRNARPPANLTHATCLWNCFIRGALLQRLV